MPAIPRQRRYDAVMGDREPKVTDKRFVQELQQRLEDKYVSSQCVKEKKLADSENRRVRKLVLDGVIEADDKRALGSDTEKGQADEWKEFWPQNPHKTLAEYEEEKRRKAEEGSRAHHAEQQQQKQQEEEQQGQETSRTDAEATGTEKPAAGTTASSSRRAPAPVIIGRYEGSQSPRIDDLIAEEDLDQLYAKASGIVYIMTPVPRGAGGKKAATKH